MKSVCFSGRKLRWLAGQPARAERDLRLQDMVAGAERVAIRIEEGQQPRPLIIAQHRPGERRRSRPGECGRAENPEPHAAEKAQRRAGGEQHHRGAEIGLLQHERDRQNDQQDRCNDITQLAGTLGRQAVKIARQCQHQRDLHDFRGLQLHEAEIDPTLRPHAGGAA